MKLRTNLLVLPRSVCSARAGVGAGAPEQERVLFSLVGPDPEMRRKRHVVFESLARRMTAEHKLATVAKITQEIFTGVVDETLPFAPCAEVVYDALVIVGMKVGV